MCVCELVTAVSHDAAGSHSECESAYTLDEVAQRSALGALDDGRHGDLGLGAALLARASPLALRGLLPALLLLEQDDADHLLLARQLGLLRALHLEVLFVGDDMWAARAGKGAGHGPGGGDRVVVRVVVDGEEVLVRDV